MTEATDCPTREDRLQGIVQRHLSATKAPWRALPAKNRGQRIANEHGVTLFVNERDNQLRAKVDAEFIAHARSDIPYLLNIVRTQWSTPHMNRIRVSSAAERPPGVENLRLERAQAANVILRQIGLPDATLEQIAMLMRWADTYQQDAIRRALDAFDIPMED